MFRYCWVLSNTNLNQSKEKFVMTQNRERESKTERY